ncbi:hypothetical protein Phum_PHUM447260 [Pediculus humanus corporis]|uniref:Protein commissureless n=1 Tax=Pediculus humanus subsp. corporis TaxID=121224 RepID=E0VU79_PEDHC|nr:uncharacterized protein Phum_PHUM447260 [Pediculus humanus corporis]EEB16935.1 hypothetical protein Phum_PHUM447260 [Pediculus humanus corporis]
MIVNGTIFQISEIQNKPPQYEQLLADVWVGIVLTLLLLSCVCCMCSCLLYHKFQQWKRSALRSNDELDVTSSSGMNVDCESLPSYTMASGLPTYEEAVQQMDKKSEKSSDNNLFKSSEQWQNIENKNSSVFDYFQSLTMEKT